MKKNEYVTLCRFLSALEVGLGRVLAKIYASQRTGS